jgi:hypothetical protein
MTIPQIHGFLEAILRRTATQNAVFISNTAVAAQSDPKNIKKAVEGYMKQRVKDQSKKPKTRQQLVEDEKLFGIN